MAEEPPDEEMPAWIDRVAGAAGALGLNRVRVRWKLQRWVNQRRGAARRREQAIDHLRYQHRVCPKCTAVNARDEQVCTRCGTALESRPREMLGRLGLRGPVITSMSTVIALAILAVYVRTSIASGGGFDIDIDVLIRHGGNLPARYPDFEPWRYATSVFLHAGLLHLAFNLVSLAIVGPQVEEEYGRWPMLFIFVATGIAASFGSRLTGLDGVGIGASGAVMGLIGVAAAAGQRAGTTRGRHRRNDMLKWALYTMFFGFVVGADNRAHLAGFLAGAAIGLAVSPRLAARRPARIAGNVLGAIAMVAMLGTVALTMVPPVRVAPQYQRVP
jgi:rhomboid protease GluP